MTTSSPHEFTIPPTINLNIRRMLEQEYEFTHTFAEGITAAISTQDKSELTKDYIKILRIGMKELKIDIIKWMIILQILTIGITGLIFNMLKSMGY